MATATKRFICIHGHFYQPPRENPWLETVETQDTAAPYHDWNERVCAECYATNGAARTVNNKNQIIRIVNNYSRMSFDFGPTLMSWLKENAPRTYRMILDGERRGRKFFRGHSSAVAQVYNHVIMPLANLRDKITQIRWGIADYKSHFGIEPEGMWLAETAADTETLELLAQHGIKFTILAPHQCRRIRPLKAEATPDEPVWTTPLSNSVDTTRPYRMRFNSGVSIAVFFYDGPTSRAIAFEGLLNSGENFAARLKAGFRDSAQPQLESVATDGESYGHHHRHGEMALAYAVRLLEQDKNVKLTNYGDFLDRFPPEWECEIVDDTSWSCAHGVERWRSNCGCNGGKPGWNQKWRTPLRQALDDLRDAVSPLTEEEGARLFKDVWAARDGYIDVILDRSEESVSHFLQDHQNHQLNAEECVRALQLMEMQRHAQLMYTSCGWFFDEISGIETEQVIAYAARVLQLARKLFGEDAATLEAEFVRQLGTAPSNIPAQKNGANVYEHSVKSMAVGLEQVGAHYAISSVFTSYPEQTDLFCYTIRRQAYEVETSGRGRLAIGKAHICSKITDEQETVIFAVMHFGDQNITAAVKSYDAEQEAADAEFIRASREAVIRADFPEVIRGFDRYFAGRTYSIHSLFRDEQQRIVELILKPRLQRVEASLGSIYEDQASLLHFLSQSGLQRPAALTLAATFAINAGLRRALESDPIDTIQVRTYLGLAKADQVELDKPLLGYIADRHMKRAMVALKEEVVEDAEQTATLENALQAARTISELPFELNLWQAQNFWYDVYRRRYGTLTQSVKTPAEKDSDEDAQGQSAWEEKFKEIGRLMGISVDELVIEEETPILEAAPQGSATES